MSDGLAPTAVSTSGGQSSDGTRRALTPWRAPLATVATAVVLVVVSLLFIHPYDGVAIGSAFLLMLEWDAAAPFAAIIGIVSAAGGRPGLGVWRSNRAGRTFKLHPVDRRDPRL